jgi:hypothetical protein
MRMLDVKEYNKLQRVHLLFKIQFFLNVLPDSKIIVLYVKKLKVVLKC